MNQILSDFILTHLRLKAEGTRISLILVERLHDGKGDWELEHVVDTIDTHLPNGGKK